jgi:hypothetical protein
LPWRTTPDPTDNFHRLLCRGWQCGASEYPIHKAEEFGDLIDGYTNGALTTAFPSRIRALIAREYHPALCMVGFFELYGLAGFPQNLTSAHAPLTAGASHDLWSCFEALSLHPEVSDSFGNVRKAANLGGVWSMIQVGLRSTNDTEAIRVLRHLATSMTPGWWKRRRSGHEYALAVATILRLDDKNLSDAWATIEKMAVDGHLPAAIWMAEGLETGEIGRKNVTEAIGLLRDFAVRSPWGIEIAAVLEAENEFDRIAVLRLAAKLGNPGAEALLSFPALFDNGTTAAPQS